jgi:hypothetical protein
MASIKIFFRQMQFDTVAAGMNACCLLGGWWMAK